ncbi:uncharacterized protein si:ch211-67e16.3 [Triplophysa rosa]|uniref:Ig-like domain-containing protein n=1 Tax=Triplophysa rosa TaxID=992332 RepID=A0A9W7WUY3_TRIRA|nr:uncharacterized protein si:ch211-67e16.3 [Triplophysa rosa]KAI7809012.1 hypothetical protein IRJ41_025631 [Triplophysa rosa]
MTDTITLLTFSLFLILQNVCSQGDFYVSAPLDHTLNEDGSVNVTCEHDEHKDWEWDAKLKMKGGEVVCEVSPQNSMNSKCTWLREGENKFKFTLKNLEARHKDELFFCEISKVRPIPIKSIKGKETKLFQGSNIPFPPPGRTCSCPTPTSGLKSCPPPNSPGNKYELLLCVMLIWVVLLLLYSAIITGVYIRLRVTKVESSDIPTYMPMKRKVKRHDADNTEYEDMRKVQKQGHIRDSNYNC